MHELALLRRLIGEIIEFRLLASDWDGEGAHLPSNESIKDAIFFSRLITQFLLPEPMLLASGNVSLYWNNDNIYAELEFLDNSRIAYFIKRNEDKHKGVIAFDQNKMPALFPTLFQV